MVAADILRKTTPTSEEIRLFKDLVLLHCHPGEVPPYAVGVASFFAHKKQVAQYNKQRAAQIPKKKGVSHCPDRKVKHHEEGRAL